MKTTSIHDAHAAAARASLGDRALAYGIDIAKSVYRLTLRRIKRTQDKVNSEYNQLHWQKILSDKAWDKTDNLTDFLAPADIKIRLRKVDNQILQIDGQNYYRYRIRAWNDLIGRFIGDATEIVELGTGYGYNLFSLHVGHPNWTLKGFDISPNGVEAGRQIAKRFGVSDQIVFDRIDLTDASDLNLAAIAGKFVLTYFCIEQIPYDVRSVVENIIASKPKRVVHVEPTIEMLNLTQPRDLVSLLYIRSVDYQTQLFSTLDELERQGRVRVIARKRMPFAPSINNDGLLYCWEPS